MIQHTWFFFRGHIWKIPLSIKPMSQLALHFPASATDPKTSPSNYSTHEAMHIVINPQRRNEPSIRVPDRILRINPRRRQLLSRCIEVNSWTRKLSVNIPSIQRRNQYSGEMVTGQFLRRSNSSHAASFPTLGGPENELCSACLVMCVLLVTWPSCRSSGTMWKG